MKQEELSKKLLSPSKNSRLEKLGKGLTFACLSLIFSLVQLGIHQENNLVHFQ